MGKFALVRFFAAVLLFAGVGDAFAEGATHCWPDARPCEDQMDSLFLSEVPDSINTTLQVELDRDTSFVFYGTVMTFDVLAYLRPYNSHARSAQNSSDPFQHSKYGSTVFNDKITEEEKERFAAWALPHIDTMNARVASSPNDLNTTFHAAANEIDYALVKLTYNVKKVYNRETKKWVDPTDDQKTYIREMLVRRGAFVVKDPLSLRANRSAIRTHSEFDRIFLSNGNSTIFDAKKLDSLDAFASQRGTFVPQGYVVEVIKNMSQIYMNRIQQALAEGNKDELRKTIALLDSFDIKAQGSFIIGPVTKLSCQTRQFMSLYLGTFEDNLKCEENPATPHTNDGQIFVILRDSINVMYKSGALDKKLAELPSGERAFWQILAASLSASQDDMNALIKANADSIKKVEQRNFVTKKYYKEPTFGNLTAQVGMGGGLSLPLGDASNYYPVDGTVYMWLSFTYKGFDFGYSIHSMKSDNLTDSTFANAMFIDFLFGYRTLLTRHFEHRILAGPSVIFTDIKLEDHTESKYDLDNEAMCRFNVASVLDFYFTGINHPDPTDKRAMLKDHIRAGLRLVLGYSAYATDILKNADGGNFYATLSFVLQGYGSRYKVFGE